MKNYIIAWRNLWRNRRRTLITAASVFFAVIFALFFRSLQLGSYDKMFRDAIEAYSGYIQVQQTDFWDDRIVDNSFPTDPQQQKALLSDPNVAATIPRFESFALASNGPQTKGVLVMGVDPEKEKVLSDIRERKVRFRFNAQAIDEIRGEDSLPDRVKELAASLDDKAYTSRERLRLDLGIEEKDAGQLMPVIERITRFSNGDIHMGEPGAWLGDKLSQYLHLDIGDTVVLISQGYHATTAAGKYEIKGIIKLPLPELDSRIVYLPLDICQQLYNAGQNLTSLTLHVIDNSENEVSETIGRISPTLPAGLRLMDWKEMNQVLVTQVEADNRSGMIMIGILYLVIAFGVFGTVLMMTAERRREFGVLVAIGMQKKKLASIVSLEMLYIGFLGILAGSAFMIPVVLYGLGHPIVFRGEMSAMFESYGMDAMMAFRGIDTYFLWQMFIVGLMVLLALFYPVRKIFKLKVVNALRV